MKNNPHSRIPQRQFEKTYDGGFTIKELFIDRDRELLLQSYTELQKKGYRCCNPLAREYFDKLIRMNSDMSCGWLWYADLGGRRWILGMNIDSEPIGVNGNEGFAEWLRRFNPTDCNDWLLVPRLYCQVLIFGEPDWKGIANRQSQSEKEILSFSRGLVAWESQYRFLIKTADDSIPSQQVKDLIHGYRRYQTEALHLLENLKIGQRSVRSVFDDHNNFFLGTPDHFASGLLSRHIRMAPDSKVAS